MKNIFHDRDFGLLVLRVVVGAVFLIHGYQKFAMISGVIGFFSHLGFPAFFAYLVATVETLGGLSLILGYGSKIASALLAVVMAVAIVKVHGPNGFMVGNGGYEFTLTLLAANVAILYSGVGRYSLGSNCGGWCSKGTCPSDR